MTKILSISNDIKINKDNVELPYTKVVKNTNSSTSVTLTLTTAVSKGVALVLIDRNMKAELGIIAIHNGKVAECDMVYGSSTISKSGQVVTIEAETYSTITLIDVNGNIWS